MASRILAALADRAEAEGYQPGSEAFAQRMVVLKVDACQDLKGHPCMVCPHVEVCVPYRDLYELKNKKVSNNG